MNQLEKLGMEKLLEHLYAALERCHEKNEERMRHERIFIKSDIERAIKVAKAIEENGETKK